MSPPGGGGGGGGSISPFHMLPTNDYIMEQLEKLSQTM